MRSPRLCSPWVVSLLASGGKSSRRCSVLHSRLHDRAPFGQQSHPGLAASSVQRVCKRMQREDGVTVTKGTKGRQEIHGERSDRTVKEQREESCKRMCAKASQEFRINRRRRDAATHQAEQSQGSRIDRLSRLNAPSGSPVKEELLLTASRASHTIIGSGSGVSRANTGKKELS